MNMETACIVLLCVCLSFVFIGFAVETARTCCKISEEYEEAIARERQSPIIITPREVA